MKIHFTLLLLLLTLTTLTHGQTTLIGNPHVANEIIISFSENSTQFDRSLIANSLGTILQGADAVNSSIGKEILLDVSSYPVNLGGNTYNSEVELIGNLNGQHANVDHADFNYIVSAEQMSFSEFLGNSNMNEYSPISANCEHRYPGGALEGEDVDVGESTRVIKVGILDTGLDPYYSTINKYVAGEANVLLDDDSFIQQPAFVTGYNPANPIALDENGHGTAVAGIIAGLSDRAGIKEDQLELYIIKCFDENGQGTLFNMLQAVRVANIWGLDAINLSWSYSTEVEDINSHGLEQLLQQMSNEDDVIIVAGAGNDSENLETYNLAPANLANINNLITVAAVVGEEEDCDGTLASFSNYGTPVEIAAPGASISAPGLNGFWTINASGTSFAAPIVTAAVIQSWFAHLDEFANGIPANTVHPVCSYVVNTATPVTSLEPYGIDGVVNFRAACETNYTLRSAGSIDFAIRNDSDKESFLKEIEASPNPFHNSINLNLRGTTEETIYIEVLTLQGASIWRKEVFNSAPQIVEIALPADLPLGPYLLRTQQGAQISTEILLKQ